MDLGILEVLAGFVMLLMGWLHMRQGALEKALDSKADKDDVEELKSDMKQVSNNIVELKVDTTRCLTILENLARNSSKKD